MPRSQKFVDADLVVRSTAAGWLVEKDRRGPSGVVLSDYEVSRRVLELGSDRVLMLRARKRGSETVH